MTISPDPEQIRTIVFRTFLELDVDEECLDDLDERLHLDDGRYVARSYRVDDLLAMWMIEVGLIQFYDDEGNMLRTVNLFEEISPQRMAAKPGSVHRLEPTLAGNVSIERKRQLNRGSGGVCLMPRAERQATSAANRRERSHNSSSNSKTCSGRAGITDHEPRASSFSS